MIMITIAFFIIGLAAGTYFEYPPPKTMSKIHTPIIKYFLYNLQFFLNRFQLNSKYSEYNPITRSLKPKPGNFPIKKPSSKSMNVEEKALRRAFVIRIKEMGPDKHVLRPLARAQLKARRQQSTSMARGMAMIDAGILRNLHLERQRERSKLFKRIEYLRAGLTAGEVMAIHLGAIMTRKQKQQYSDWQMENRWKR